ncbi:ribonuclease III [Parvularcula bermudensis HTCC2503]|uniref:Ribonuclease 3 n=1 Tax=Parvularcula bermudensis (strain ATCC BAA-594 / HTCC2503 / KCTC 12087) TaxID=314260 RepID=E0TBD7_PARBH|nr:ribonuclease III [Parvularcula bermudensis]ADM09734.1 ribonuclease III [Parvularcula bermudensis HTCC2503]
MSTDTLRLAHPDAAAAVEAAVGHRFDDRSLLARALTHASVSQDGLKDLERLEFLGDRVLGLLAADLLWRRFPDMAEGELAPRLNALVRRETCADAARHWKLGEAVRMSAGEERTGGRNKDAILGDACESLLGAIYIDGGLGAAKTAFETYWTPRVEELIDDHADAKTALQEWAQEKGLGTPSYRDIDRDGPDHAPIFTVAVVVQGLESAEARGPNKRSAQMQAARSILVREGVWPSHD